MKDLKSQLLSMVKSDLENIENELNKNLTPHLDLVKKVAGHIIFSGGKRIRPLLVVLSSRICDYEKDDAPHFSTALEYLHTATLLHDDLVDGASLRHGRPVASSIWGNSITILTGDFLLARALSIAAKFQNVKIIDVIAEVTQNMSQGEIFQLSKKEDINLTEEEYSQIIKGKTAVLFEGACRVGALMANAQESKEKSLSDYGFNLGIAFQMADDLLDYTSETDILGKSTGADLREGKLTLPVIYALRHADKKDRDSMIEIINNKNFTVNDFKILIEFLNKYKGISYTQMLASDYILKAKNSLMQFLPSVTKDILMMLADYALVRKL